MLTDKQEKFMNALLESATTREAYESADISKSTAYSYLSNSNFKYELKKRQRENFKQSQTYLHNSLSIAIDNLNSLMVDKGINPQVRYLASKTVIESSLKVYELFDLESRIERLEGQLS